MGLNLGYYILKLHLGFEDHAYDVRYEELSPLARSTKSNRPKVMSRAQQAYGQGKTTREVAAELETKYKIVETFWELEEDNFIEVLEDAFAEDLEEVMQMSTTVKGPVLTKETEKIEAKFRRNLSNRRYDGIIPGFPTTAAQKGVSHLRKHPYAKSNPSRPSAIDTGMYMRSFRAWVEETDE